MKNKILLDDITGHKFTITRYGLLVEKYNFTKEDLKPAKYYVTIREIAEEMKNASNI